VRSRNHSSFDDIAETALEEDSAIFSKNERHKNSNASLECPRCSNCNKIGHVASRCYLKDRKDAKVNYRLRMKTARKTVILPVIIAREKGIWRVIFGNPRNAVKDRG
jgi:hypothetical protein